MATRLNRKDPGAPSVKRPSGTKAQTSRKKVGAVPTPSAEEAAVDAEFSDGWVTVRMYRDILGDCFLLRFPAGARTVHVLIDCGILQGMPAAMERARRIMANIRSVTGRLDVLVATHEHVDHLSGFAHAREIFDTIEVDELWLAWTEDPRDEQANSLREGRKRALALIENSYSALTALITTDAKGDEDEDENEDEDRPDALAGLRGLMAFSGLELGSNTSAASSTTTANILRDLRAKAGRVRFLRPGGETLTIGDAPGVAAYVLGPPRDDALLRRSNPSKRRSEVYELKAVGFEEDTFLVAATASKEGEAKSADEIARLRMSLPFGYRNLIALDPTAETIGARQDRAAISAFEKRYAGSDEDWRKVDTDWLGATEQLALKLDSDTNNTSLALAIELGQGPDSRVLLFPGDAQVGNWLSWNEHVWPRGKVRGEIGATGIEDLLAKTVLYKVGHHGSHNATLRTLGLELMTHPDLVAMIPVHQEFANGTKNWNMPFPSLLARLEERCGGRVVRADRSRSDLAATAADAAGKPDELTKADWSRFLANLREISDSQGPVAIEYRIAVAEPNE